MSRTRVLPIALVGLVTSVAVARGGDVYDPNLHVDPSLKDCSVEFAPNLTQSAFGRFVREFGSVSAYKNMSPPMTLGRRGVAIALEQITFSVEEKSDAWNDTFAHPTAYHPLGEQHAFPKLRLRAGVTDRVDLGAYYTRNPDANYGWLGLDVKYGMLRQSETMPVSLALRGAYTKTLYVHDMDMHAITANATAGRTFWNLFTPYLGLGGDLILARETSAAVDLHNETQVVPEALAGAELRYWHIALGAEVHQAALTSFEVQIAALF
jgi:hypothetical protein